MVRKCHSPEQQGTPAKLGWHSGFHEAIGARHGTRQSVASLTEGRVAGVSKVLRKISLRVIVYGEDSLIGFTPKIEDLGRNKVCCRFFFAVNSEMLAKRPRQPQKQQKGANMEWKTVRKFVEEATRPFLSHIVIDSKHITYCQDSLITEHGTDWMEEPRFKAAYEAGHATGHKFGEMRCEWRVKVLLWAATHAMHLDGDFVECGVNTGVFSRAVMEYTDFSNTNKKFYLLDTYDGIPLQDVSEDVREATREYNKTHHPECYELAKKNFSQFKNALLIRGRVPETLDQIQSDRIAYASIDMNVASTEIAAGEYLWPRLVSGAMIVLDDYNYAWWTGEQRREWNNFAERHGVQILPLPTGQGLLVKP